MARLVPVIRIVLLHLQQSTSMTKYINPIQVSDILFGYLCYVVVGCSIETKYDFNKNLTITIYQYRVSTSKVYSNFYLAIFNRTCDNFSAAHVAAQSHGTPKNGWITNLRMWSDAKKVFCVEAYISSKSYKETRRFLLKRFDLHHRRSDLAPIKTCVKKWAEKFREKGTFKGGRRGTSRTVRTQANIKDVTDSVARSPKKSIRRRSQSLGLTRSTMHNI